MFFQIESEVYFWNFPRYKALYILLSNTTFIHTVYSSSLHLESCLFLCTFNHFELLLIILYSNITLLPLRKLLS